jgi:hypothetical protein
MANNYFQEILNLAAASSRDHPAFPGLPSPHILQAAQVQQQAHQAAAQQQAQQLAQQQAAQQAAQQQQQGKHGPYFKIKISQYYYIFYFVTTR